MAWWFGALLPLRILCRQLSYPELFQVMDRFGHQAGYLVSALLLAGLSLAYITLGSFDALVSTNYGLVLLFKILVVSTILSIAAHHKFILVPRLKKHKGREALARSINIEMTLALTILIFASVLTSLVGPENLA